MVFKSSGAVQKHRKIKGKSSGSAAATTVHNCFRPSMISKSEKVVCEIMKVLTEKYINPFDVVIESNELFNLSSGVPLQCTDVLSCWEMSNKIQEFYR